MQYRLLWISPLRTTLIVAAISFALSYPLVGILWIFNSFSANPGRPNWMILTVLPVAICLLTALFTFLATLAYNLMVSRGLFLVMRVGPVIEVDAHAAPAEVVESTGVVASGEGPSPELEPSKYYRF